MTTTMEAAVGTEENWTTTLTVNHLPLEDDLSSINDICEDEDQYVICEDQGDDSLDSFSGFSDPGGRFAITTESVHFPHLPGFVQSDVESCHGRIEQILPQRDSSHYRCPVPSWVHVFRKSKKTSSLRTQGDSVAYTEQPTTKKARHCLNRRTRKKLKKQNSVLTEATIPPSVLTNLLSIHEIENGIIVFDGGEIDNPPIKPPDGVDWRSIPIGVGSHVHICDEVDPNRGLTFQRVDNVLSFIRLPRAMSLNILSQVGHYSIIKALHACEKLKKTSLVGSDRKRIFGDYGTKVMYTCAGVQVSRNSKMVHEAAPYMEALPKLHWRVLMRSMKMAERCFEEIGDSVVLSHVHHAKSVVPFQTMKLPHTNHTSPLKYYGGIAFGCNVFLRCHTDADYTMSMAQIHLKDKGTYHINDDIVVYFCFSTLGVALSLRTGDYLLFNALIPHCVSSRCRHNYSIMCVSMYLKNAVVGMNNNALSLTKNQAMLAKRYHSIVTDQINCHNRQQHLTARYKKFYASLYHKTLN